MQNNNITPFLKTLFALALVVVLIAAPFTSIQADPVSVLIAVVTAITAVLVVDATMCDVEIVFNCDDGPGGGSGGGGRGGGGGGGSVPSPAASGGSGGGGGSIPVACSTSLANACGMHGTGFIVGGVCNATVPPNSACPTPTISEEGFYADPDRVRKGNPTTLHWDVENATVCSLTGGGLELPPLGIVGEQPISSINSATTYTLTCWNGTDGPQASEEATVTIVPSYQEI